MTETEIETKTPEIEPPFKIKSLDDVRDMLVIAKGGDPNAIQALVKFMDLESNAERSYFPDKTITLCVGQLLGFGKVYYQGEEWDPCTLVADALSVPFMGYKGFKSNQYVDMTRTSTDLSALSSSNEEVKQGFISRIRGRGKEE